MTTTTTTTTMDSLCDKRATRCLKIPLKSTEQIYLVFLLPTVLSCATYVVHFSSDLVVAVQHFREGNPVWASCTIALMFAPAIAYFVLTVSRPDWWMNEDQRSRNRAVAWFGIQILQLVAFPLFALYRYAQLIVLAVDATMLSAAERAKTLNAAAAPAAIELYFFLQAWFQAAPQAIFQTHLLLRNYTKERTHQTVVVHVLCVLMSIVVVSREATSFQRFESQRMNGRKLPWAMWLKKYQAEEEFAEEKKPLQLEMKLDSGRSSTSGHGTENGTSASNGTNLKLERQISVTPPLPPKNVQMRPPPAPLRGITTVPSLPIPEMPAPPRPVSVRGVTTVPSLQIPEMPAPPRPDSIVREPEIPSNERRVNIVDANGNGGNGRWQNFKIPKRKYSIKGLDEDDPVGEFVSFVWWFFFIFARVFAITFFFEFYPYWLLGVLGLHYVFMIAYIFYHSKYYDVTNVFLTLWLGFVYIFCIIEYRVKFKHADTWIFGYYALVLIQNSIMTVTWFIYGNWQGFWYSYMFFAIFISMALCNLSAGVYNVLLKPKKRRVYAS